MSEAHGTQAWIGFGVESTYGTTVARSKFAEMTSDSLELKQGRQAKPSLRGCSRRRWVKKKKSVEGGFELQMEIEGLEVLLKHAFGSVATTGAGPFTHTFSLASALPVGLSIEVNRDSAAIGGSSSDLFAGCQISKLTFKQSMEEPLMLSFEIIGKDASFAAVSTPTFVTPITLLDWETFTCEIDTGGGYTFIDVSEIELTIDNNLAADRYKLGQLARKGLGRGGHRTVSGKFTKEYDSLSERNLYRNLTVCALRFKWTDGGAKSLTITVPAVEWMGNDPKADTEGILSMPMDFEARAVLTDNDELSLVLVNSTVSVP